MKNLSVWVISCALCLCAACVTAQPAHDSADTFVIVGRVVIYGNEPFTFAGIDSEDGKTYAVSPRETERELWSLQGRRVEFTVRVLDGPPDANARYLGGVTVSVLSWRLMK